jgi:glycerol-3-phosphate dehydrogenase subunit B
MTLSSAPQQYETDLFIIGSGMAGMSAALFAADCNINTVVAGAAGGFEYASGLMDLWGVSLTKERALTQKPWEMLSLLKAQQPDHPYAKLKNSDISAAFSKITAVLEKNGPAYRGYPKLNHRVLTPFGTIHPTFRLPPGLKANADAFKSKPPCLILDFKGLREFSARFFCEMLKKKWPKLSDACIEFPQTDYRAEVFTPFLARAMETGPIQDQFVKKVTPLLKGKSCLGVPAMLGVQSSEAIRQRLQERLGVMVFEIPTSPVSVPGSRLKEALVKSLEGTSVTRMFNQRVTTVQKASDNAFECVLGTGDARVTIRSKAVIMATGRFLSSGLVTQNFRIKEPVFNLPVCQPAKRDHWHATDYFDPSGHKINKAGIETDDSFRPVHPEKGVVYDNLYAVGSILAHQDWARTKSGSGLAIATAYKAVNDAGHFLLEPRNTRKGTEVK